MKRLLWSIIWFLTIVDNCEFSVHYSKFCVFLVVFRGVSGDLYIEVDNAYWRQPKGDGGTEDGVPVIIQIIIIFFFYIMDKFLLLLLLKTHYQVKEEFLGGRTKIFMWLLFTESAPMSKKKCNQSLFWRQRKQNISATIRIGQELRCLPYAGYFLDPFKKENLDRQTRKKKKI